MGASARAAAMSGLRAGLRPWCADLFADLDLRRCCPAAPVTGRYPQDLVRLAQAAPPGPWIYTGGLENWPDIVARISKDRPLWGNGPEVLRRVRSPLTLFATLRRLQVPCPAVRLSPPRSPNVRWLVKPRAGAGGRGIRVWKPGSSVRSEPARLFFQEYIPGIPCAAVYLANADGTRLVGVTRQLVGEPWLHAGRFQYCGSIGPVPLTGPARRAFDRLGAVLTEAFAVRGLFGVDCVLQDGTPWPVEVNPRYTASVEVLEWCTGQALLALHGRVFDRHLAAADPFPPVRGVLGKAILFARAPLTVPEIAPWREALQTPFDPQVPPAFADIPPAGQQIRAGQPILTFFAQADSETKCRERLKEIAAALDRQLFN